MPLTIKTIILFILLPFLSFSQSTDTTIQGVRVEFNYNVSIFPGEWRIAPINAMGKKMDEKEIPRTRAVMEKALVKYPKKVLLENLKVVHFLSFMKFFEVQYGGTNSNDAVYLVNNGKPLGYTDKYLEQTFHHEFSSVLLRKFSNYLDTTTWKSLNEPGFIYNDPEDGVGAIRNNQSSQDLDSTLGRKGILTQYALSSIENDMNTIAQNLFCPEKNFWPFVDKYPRLRSKVKMLVNFYGRVDEGFTEEYFRRLMR
jgi:hypothetical protein